MARTLVIVESPAKARTIEKYLGKDYTVTSSIGHIRDLPDSASEIPEQYKNKAWARLGLDVDNNFSPLYIVPPEKRQHVAKLRSLLKEADQLILATDDDREGESIAWHLYDELKPKIPVKRMVFHEITQQAIQAAIANPRSIDSDLVHAQEARRALDRLYGYEVSPVLWRKIAPKLSAGRVQSVATRMLVERERERMKFVSGEFWDIDALFATQKQEKFNATLQEWQGKRLASGKDFDPLTGKLRPESQAVLLTAEKAQQLAQDFKTAAFKVHSVEEKPFTQKPYPPFITSTLQQEAGRKLGFSAKRTMQSAQKLYENGYITYMRTDSTTLSSEAMTAARQQVQSMYGAEYLHPTPRNYDKKAKNAQEAHEAIRPAGSVFKTPQSLKNELNTDEYRLYDLIWKRTVASQMADAKGKRIQVKVSGADALFAASGKTIEFAGFLRAYVEGSDDPEAALEDKEILLPLLKVNDPLTAQNFTAKEHHTQAPARYTEASLIQALESAGIGRPSTYASIISTIQDRGYVSKRGTALVPTWTAFATLKLLENYFGKLVDYNFTANMESALDEIAGGRKSHVPYLQAFYFGDEGLKQQVDTQMSSIDPREVSAIDVPRMRGEGIEVRLGRYGPFLRQGEKSVSLPDTIAPDELTPEKATELLQRTGQEGALGTHPETGEDIHAKVGRFGPYVQMGDKLSSLFPTDNIETLTLERAIDLLKIPRLLGKLDGEEVWAMNGRFGPYLKKGKDNRTLSKHEDLLTLTLEQAQNIFATAKPRFGSAVLKQFEYSDRSPIEVKRGRFGEYLTDGENNAYLKATDIVATMTPEGAREIMAERGKPPKAKAAKAAKTSTKKSSDKTSTTTAKKASSKKAASKKPTETAEVAKGTWQDLKAHLGILSDTEKKLIVAIQEGQKIEEVAPNLGLEVAKAKGMRLQIAKKLQGAWRKQAQR